MHRVSLAACKIEVHPRRQAPEDQPVWLEPSVKMPLTAFRPNSGRCQQRAREVGCMQR